jgi:hypothetical protein
MAPAKPAETGLPWIEEHTTPPPRVTRLAIVRRYEPFPLNWSVAALTLATAVGIVFGSHQANPSKPRELLPVMIVLKTR